MCSNDCEAFCILVDVNVSYRFHCIGILMLRYYSEFAL